MVKRRRLGLLEVFGLAPIRERLSETLFMLRGDPHTPPSRFGWSSRRLIPLHRAADSNAVANARVLIDHEAEVDALTHEPGASPGQSPLHHAAEEGHVDMVRLLLDAGADIDRQDEGRDGYPREGGMTPLHVAAEKGHLAVIELLLERGADRWIEDNEDRTPWDAAEWYDQDECCDLINDY